MRLASMFAAFAAFLFAPVLAFAQVVAPVMPLEDDPFKLLEQIVQAAGAKNWLLLVPLALVLVMFFFRKYIGPKVPFFLTDRGGAVLALITAVLTALITAVMAPGPHTFVSVLMATVGVLAANKLIFLWFNKIVSPNGNDKAQELEVKVAALEAKLAVNSKAAADATNQAVSELKGLTGTSIR